jgi:NitT/TauT family transport system ATP-binding protein
MFQESALFPWLSTFENVAYGPAARGEAVGTFRARAEALLARVGLAGFRDKYPAQLSGGMQRRAELARALINEPRVMILDDPFRGLDALTKKLMLEYYAGLCQATPSTQFFVTTDVDEALFLADRVLVMSQIPMRVRAVFEIDLPRPRTLTTVFSDDRANSIKQQILALLREEALKAFAPGRWAVGKQVQPRPGA